MYRHSEKQIKFVEFYLPFGGKLLANNRWVRLAGIIPWHEIEEQYCRNLTSDGKGPPALSVRMALAALIIKERLGVTDEECVEQIRENPYLQYFCGMKAFGTDRPFHPTMLVHFRKRFPADFLKSMNEVTVARAAEKTVKDDDHDATKGSCGIYPASVHADRIYRTRDNLRYFKKHRIRLSGPSPRLGKPPKETPENAARLRAEAIQAHQDKLDREKCLL